ncbi:MAG: carboxypeptidase regulatory-like domain-containing protein, partial [Deltaproteobacteria bacterium]
MRKVLVVLAIVVMAVAVWLVIGGREEGERVAGEPGQVNEEARSGDKEPGGKPIDSRQPLPRGPMMAGREAEFEQDEEPEGPLLLEGQVLDEGGLPVEGATVTIDTKPPRTATTERDGTFQFEHLIGRQYVLTARLGDRAGGPVRHQLTEKSPPVIIRLKPAASVEVTVLAAGYGKPVEGAGVELRGAEKRRGHTGAGGRLVFRGVPSGWYSVKATAEGYAPAFKPAVVPPLAGPRPVKVELRLKEGAELSGEVVDEDGAPVAGAHVLAVDTRRFIDLQETKEDGAVTDEEGRFVISALPAGTYRLEASHENYAPGRAGPVEHDGQRPKGGIRIVMEEGGVVAGRVVDTSGTPVAWASVRVVERSKRRRGRARFRKGTTADERGEFELKGLPRGRLALVAVSAAASSDAVEIDLAQEKEKRDLEIVLDVTGSIAGKVVTSSGEPVPEVQVIAVPDFWKGGMRRLMRLRGRAQAMTDGGGNFELKGLPDGDYRLHASRWGGGMPRLFMG